MKLWLGLVVLVVVGAVVGGVGYWLSTQNFGNVGGKMAGDKTKIIRLSAAEAIQQASSREVGAVKLDDFIIRETSPDTKPFLNSTGSMQAALVLFLTVKGIIWDSVTVDGKTVDRATLTTTFDAGGKQYTLVFPVIGSVQCPSCGDDNTNKNIKDIGIPANDKISVRVVSVPTKEPMPSAPHTA